MTFQRNNSCLVLIDEGNTDSINSKGSQCHVADLNIKKKMDKIKVETNKPMKLKAPISATSTSRI